MRDWDVMLGSPGCEISYEFECRRKTKPAAAISHPQPHSFARAIIFRDGRACLAAPFPFLALALPASIRLFLFLLLTLVLSALHFSFGHYSAGHPLRILWAGRLGSFLFYGWFPALPPPRLAKLSLLVLSSFSPTSTDSLGSTGPPCRPAPPPRFSGPAFWVVLGALGLFVRSVLFSSES